LQAGRTELAAASKGGRVILVIGGRSKIGSAWIEQLEPLLAELCS
jgi:hypothetical protein